MGSACSIENAQYDASKFQKSKAVMESSADDAEKFAKLREIWVAKEPEHGTQQAGETTSSDAHKKSTKDLHASAKPEAAHVDHSDHAKHDEDKDATPASHTHDGKECHADHVHEAKKDSHDAHVITTDSNHAHETKKDEHAHETKNDDHANDPKKDEHHVTKKEDHQTHGDATHCKTEDHKKKEDAHDLHDAKSNDGARTEISDHHADKPKH